MSTNVASFFKKNGILLKDLIYLVREDNKTAIHMTNGRVIHTFIPLKVIRDQLPQEEFWSITKGVVVSAAHVCGVEDSVYIMSDGHRFTGRLRTAGEHKRNKQIVDMNLFKRSSPGELTQDNFSWVDNSPLPLAVVELQLGGDGHDIDFVFRYCNSAMLSLNNMDSSDILGKPISSVFDKLDNKLLFGCADIALNGGSRMLCKPASGDRKPMQIYCYQPKPGYCACMIVEIIKA